jgi:hypothetical protein
MEDSLNLLTRSLNRLTRSFDPEYMAKEPQSDGQYSTPSHYKIGVARPGSAARIRHAPPPSPAILAPRAHTQKAPASHCADMRPSQHPINGAVRCSSFEAAAPKHVTLHSSLLQDPAPPQRSARSVAGKLQRHTLVHTHTHTMCIHARKRTHTHTHAQHTHPRYEYTNMYTYKHTITHKHRKRSWQRCTLLSSNPRQGRAGISIEKRARDDPCTEAEYKHSLT